MYAFILLGKPTILIGPTKMTSENLMQSGHALRIAPQRFLDMVSMPSSSSEVPLLLGGAALMLVVISYLAFAGSTPATTMSRKAQQARAMREAYKSMERDTSKLDNNKTNVSSSLEST